MTADPTPSTTPRTAVAARYLSGLGEIAQLIQHTTPDLKIVVALARVPQVKMISPPAASS
jgi:hypothetical protein